MNIIKAEDTEFVSGKPNIISSDEDRTEEYRDAQYEKAQEEARNYEENYREAHGENE